MFRVGVWPSQLAVPRDRQELAVMLGAAPTLGHPQPEVALSQVPTPFAEELQLGGDLDGGIDHRRGVAATISSYRRSFNPPARLRKQALPDPTVDALGAHTERRRKIADFVGGIVGRANFIRGEH